MTHAETYGITGLDSTDTEYTVEQSLVRNKYKGINSARETDINGKQELFEAKEEFPFTDAEGEDAFTDKPRSLNLSPGAVGKLNKPPRL